MADSKLHINVDVSEHPYWKPLMPVVEFCLENGCEFADSHRSRDEPFTPNQGGVNSTRLVTPGEVSEMMRKIRERFEFPKEVTYDNSTIGDNKNYTKVTLYSRFEWEALERGREASRKRLRAMLEAAQEVAAKSGGVDV